jgi:predicted kinase
MNTEQPLLVVIPRGGSGSGKSTWARRHFPDGKVVSTDKFFEQTDDYVFSKDLLPEAHRWCFRQFDACIQKPPLGLTHLIVDNTNTRIDEYSAYVLAAESYGHAVKIVTFVYDPVAAYKRNVHDTPLSFCMRQWLDLQEGSAQMPARWDHDYALWDETWPYATTEMNETPASG